jgi:hypothetical protein
MALSNTTKLILGLGIFLVIGAAGLVIGAVAWFRANKDTLIEAARKIQADGRAFGASHAQSECVAEGLARNENCGEGLCEIRTQLFLGSCLGASAADPATCAGVPRKRAVLAGVAWQQRRCAAAGRIADQKCARLMGTVQTYCDGT